MRNIFSLLAALILFGALGAAAQSGQTDLIAHASRYQTANTLRPDSAGQTLGKDSILDVVAHKRRRDCKTAPGLCLWWEHCCEVFDPDGETIGHICADKTKRCPLPE